MKRTGILDVDVLTEKLVRGLFLAAPDAQVFLLSGNNERARKLEREYPCWTLDTYQDVIDEADVIITGVDRHALDEIANKVQLRSTQTLVSLVPGLPIQHLQTLFRHNDCVRLMLTLAAEINKSSVLLTPADQEVQRLFSLLGPLTVLPDESDFDSATVNLCMTSGFCFLAEGLQCWLTDAGRPIAAALLAEERARVQALRRASEVKVLPLIPAAGSPGPTGDDVQLLIDGVECTAYRGDYVIRLDGTTCLQLWKTGGRFTRLEGDPLQVASWLQACHDAGISVGVQINESTVQHDTGHPDSMHKPT